MTPSARILVLDRPITARELAGLLGNPFEDMVKFVVDLDRRLVARGRIRALVLERVGREGAQEP